MGFSRRQSAYLNIGWSVDCLVRLKYTAMVRKRIVAQKQEWGVLGPQQARKYLISKSVPSIDARRGFRANKLTPDLFSFSV